MNYHNITYDDMRNGDGLRVVLWLSGCHHHCYNCHNPITHNPKDGLPFNEPAKQELYQYLENDYCSGITLSGGDPLFMDNREELLLLLKDIRARFASKTIWCYTGYLWEEICDLPHMNYIDILVDGPYIDALSDEQLCWKGSKNQRVINVPLSLQNPNQLPVIYCSDYYQA